MTSGTILAILLLECAALITAAMLIYLRRSRYLGCVVVINGEERTIVDYDGRSGVATIDRWVEAPSADAVFRFAPRVQP